MKSFLIGGRWSKHGGHVVQLAFPGPNPDPEAIVAWSMETTKLAARDIYSAVRFKGQTYFSLGGVDPAERDVVVRTHERKQEAETVLVGAWKLTASGSRMFAVDQDKLLTSADGQTWLPFEGFASEVLAFNDHDAWETMLAVEDVLYILPQTSEPLLRYDVQARTVESFPTPWKWRSMTASALLGTTLYVSGGFWGGREGDGEASAELWAFADGAWRQLPSMPTARYEHTMSAVGLTAADGRLVVIGGASGVGRQALNSVEMFVPAENVWVQCPPLTRERTEHAAFADGPVVIVAGGVAHKRVGQSFSDTLVEEIEALDLATFRWRTVAPLPLQSAFHRVGLV